MTVERVRVSEVLIPDRASITPDPLVEYTAIGVRSFGKGIFHYAPQPGDKLGGLRFFDVQPGRLVISNIKGWEGAIAVSSEVDDGCVASNRFLQYVPRDDRIDVRWASWFFLSERGIELIQRASPGSADRNRTLAIDRFEALEITLPPIDDQRRVAARLDYLASRRNALSSARERTSALGGAIPIAVPVHADQHSTMRPTRLGEVLELVRSPLEIDPVAPYVSVGIRSFGKGLFHYPERPGAEIGKLRFQTVTSGLLAISNIKAWEGAVATTSDADTGTVASNRFLFFRPVAGEKATDYFWARLLGPEGLAALGYASPGSADRNRTLSVDRFNAITLELPDLAEQVVIGSEVSRARRAVVELSASVGKSDSRVAALLPAALNEAFAGLS